MNTRHDIQEELKNMGSPLAELSPVMPYAVPTGYFEQFEPLITNTIKNLNEDETIPDWGKQIPYAVPNGYFEALPDDITDRVLAEHAISSIPAQAPFKTPPGYFESLPARILHAAKTADAPQKRRMLPQPIKWLAAAILVLGIGLGSYRIIMNAQQPQGTEKILSSVSNNEIQEYLQHVLRVDINRIQSADLVNNMNVDNKEIVQYLNETGWD